MRDIKDATQTEAEEIAEQRYGREFDELPKPIQHDVWCEAENRVQEKLADEIDNAYERFRERQDGQQETHWDELELMRRQGK